MTRHLLAFVVLTFCVCSCSDNYKKLVPSPKFKTFEISYTNGWTKGFSFIVDSNKIYFSPKKLDSMFYGILPDSIFNLIDNIFLKIKSDTTIKSKDQGCVDCSIISIQVVAKEDTICINQTGDLDKIFLSVIRSLQTFLDNGRLQPTRATIFLETQKSVSPTPTPMIDIKFRPPATKSGR
jgi:hypothetical protein